MGRGGGGGYKTGGGGAFEVLPLRTVLAILKGGGAKSFHSLKGGTQKV